MDRRAHQSSGFSLLETLVAASVLIAVMAGLADLIARSVQLTRDAGERSAALDAAAAKLEWLRARALTFDGDGAPLTDPALAPSSPAAVDQTMDGYSEWLDATGQPVMGAGSTSGVFLRRWSITPLDPSSPDALAIEVCVFRRHSQDGPASAAEVCLATIRSRQP